MSTTSPSRLSNPNTNINTNPTTPLSPFPSTPHRLPYHHPTTDSATSTTTSTPSTTDNPHTSAAIFTAEHISPTKAAATTRLNHELSTLTSWLEGLFGENGIPAHLTRWKNEVLLAEQGTFDGPVLGSFEHNLSQHPSQIQPQFQPRQITQQPQRSTPSGDSTTTLSTLELLKSLKQINLSSDYLASLLHDARLEELQTLQDRHSRIEKQRADRTPARTVLDELNSYLTPDAVDALKSLSEAAVTLGLNLDVDVDRDRDGNGESTAEGNDLVSVYARAILGRTRRKFMLEEQVWELEMLRHRIESKVGDDMLGGEHGQGAEEDRDDYQSEQLHAQTAQFNRDTKQINLKIMEYHDRITSLERQLASLRTESTSLEDVLNARARIGDRRARVKALQERFAAFNGLPPDLEDSRNEVRRAMAELESLKRRREGLFERMGTG